MADKKINELPVSSGLTDDALLPVYQNDQTQSITGALVKTFAAAAAQEYVGTAQQAAQAAEKSARQAAESIGQLGDAVERAQAARAGAEAAEQGAEAARTAIEDMRVAAVALSGSQSATVEKTTEEGVVKLTFGLPAGPAGADGAQGPQGVGITGIERTAGTGAPGTADTYTITLSDGASAAFTVYNGANGAGSGDFMASGSVAMTGELRMDGHRVTGVGAPQEDGDAVRRADLTAGNVKFTDGETFQQKYDAGQLSGADGKSAYQAAADKGYTGTEEAFNAALAGMKDGPFLPLKGGTMTGNITVPGGLYFDTQGSGFTNLGAGGVGLSCTYLQIAKNGAGGGGGKITGLDTPTYGADAANKEYVDSKSIRYGTCATSAATAAKTVTLSGFTLETGAVVLVKFTYVNTSTSATLNVNGTGAKSIRANNAAVKSNMILAGMYALFEYDGTYWQLLNPAAAEVLTFTSKTVSPSSWAANTTYSAQGYQYRASVACAGVTTSHRPDVSFSCADSVGGNFAPVADSYSGGVYLYCKTKPSGTVTVPSIVCTKGV